MPEAAPYLIPRLPMSSSPVEHQIDHHRAVGSVKGARPEQDTAFTQGIISQPTTIVGMVHYHVALEASYVVHGVADVAGSARGGLQEVDEAQRWDCEAAGSCRQPTRSRHDDALFENPTRALKNRRAISTICGCNPWKCISRGCFQEKPCATAIPGACRRQMGCRPTVGFGSTSLGWAGSGDGRSVSPKHPPSSEIP